MTDAPRPSLAIELTAHCNQRCAYCYNDWRADGGRAVGGLDTADLLERIDKLLDAVDFDHVVLTGGEPLARSDLFTLIDHLHDRGMDFQMISNGGLVTDELAERLARAEPIFVQVTLNGPDPDMHAAHSGAGHYHATLRGIETLIRHGVEVVGCVVVSRKNAATVGAILDQFLAMGVESVALSRFSPAGYSARFVDELLPTRSELITALEQAEARGVEMDLQVTMPVPPCVVDHDDYPHIAFGSCPIGTGEQEFVLGPRGELRSCTLHEQSLGDVATTPIQALIESPKVMHYRDVTPEFCAPCPHRTTCIGGCGAAAASVLGNPRGLDPLVAQHVDPEFAERLRELRAARERKTTPEARSR